MAVDPTSGVRGGAVIPPFPEGDQQAQLDELWSTYQEYLNSGDIIKGEPNDTLKTEIEQKKLQIQQLITQGASSEEIDAALQELYNKISGEGGLQLKSEKLAALENLYSQARQKVYFNSYQDAYNRYTELKSLLEGDASLEDINQKLTDFMTLLKGGRVDGSAWSFANAEAERQNAMNVLQGLVLAGNLTFERNRFSSLEADRKSQERALNSNDEAIKKGALVGAAETRTEHIEKERRHAEELAAQQTLEGINQAHQNDRLAKKKDLTGTDNDIPNIPQNA